MLDYIRSNAQSFGVKVAFGVIILVFVFWGVGSFNDRNSANVVAIVNGDPILVQQFEQAYRNAEESILRNNPGVTREQLKEQHLGRQVLRDLIQQTLLAQEAARAGVSVTPLELRQAVGRIKSFQDAQGRFDPEAYTRVLAAQRISPAQYEKDMSDQLLREKIFTLVTAPVWVDPDEAQNRYNFLREKRVVDYLFIPAKNFSGEVKVTDQDVTAYYDAHKKDFAIPPKVDVAYVSVTPGGLVKPESISEADAHNGSNAAGPGGELGWITPGKTVKPFEDAAFALKAGQVSEPVRSPFGLHIIKVEDKKPGGLKTFKDAAREVRQAMAQEQGADKLHDVLDSLIEDNILGKPLAESAARFGLKAEQSGLLSQSELEQKLGITPVGASALIATATGAPVDTALEAGDKYLVARIIKAEPASTQPLDAVKSAIVAKLTAEKALKAAVESAAARRKELKDGPLPQPLKASLGIKTAPAMDRGGNLADFNPDEALAEAVFTAKPGTWLPSAYAVDGKSEGPGALLCRVDAVLPPDPQEWNTVRDLMANGVARERVDGLYQVFIQNLASKAKVEVLNTDIVDRVNL